MRKEVGGDEAMRKQGNLSLPKRGLASTCGGLSVHTWHPQWHYVSISANQEP